MRCSDRFSQRYPAGGSLTRSVMFATPPAIATTAWLTAAHVAKGNHPRPLDLPGGSTG